MNKLEKPERLKELDPKSTLEKLSFGNDEIFADIGAGTGIFTFEAAEMTNNKVYAVDISEEKIKILNTKKLDLNAKNVEIYNNLKCLPDKSCDLILVCTVLHEVDDKETFLKIIKEKLNENGNLAIIEFHKKNGKMGPPLEIRLDEKELSNDLINLGFNLKDSFILGENFYCLVV